ncbi:MAG: hypothetical protein WC479_06320 [Candidatus Izemoplasmatales bacterium]|jgi:hypothetical protein|nr:hypothetical protein [Candidatus Izemoplasmatales bacterium]
MDIIFAALILIALIGIYVGFYLLNQKTKPPEGCEIPDDFLSCGGCKSSTCLVKTKPKTGDNHDK